MEVRQLEHFVAVMEEQHFTRAARRCNISQSALSSSIRALERELGASLLVRTTRSVKPTEEGWVLAASARPVLTAMAAARDAVSNISGRLRGSLAVGGIQTDGIVDQARLLARFHERHPDVEIRYRTGTSYELIDATKAGDLDVAFVALPEKRPAGLDVRELTSHPLMLLCRPDHPLAAREAVALELLAGETFVGGPTRSVANEAIAWAQRGAGVATRLTIQVSDLRSMLEFVANGLGVALLPGYLAELRPPLIAVPLLEPTMSWTVGVVTAKFERTTRVAREVIEMIGPPGGVERAQATNEL